MSANPRIRRLALVPFEGPDDELRRYRLARMDEIALATPPDPSLAERRNGFEAKDPGAEAEPLDPDDRRR
ncbi:MAG TPA: hypothetical protein VJT75_01600 [Thermoleophilaceae bacterium]|nr:hypothetical protein [Thermoleophilaceae bacterium]